MVAASILPITYHDGTWKFLFGKENERETSAPGWSDFGGGVDTDDESLLDAAVREGAEELTGFLGDPEQLKERIYESGGYIRITLGTYHIHVFYLNYDAQLPAYYNQNHRFLWNHPNLDREVLAGSKLFEKEEIRWFSVADLSSEQADFRPFYRRFLSVLTRSDVLRKYRTKYKKHIIQTKKKTRRIQGG